MITVYIIPVLIVILLIFAQIKKVNSFKSFTQGAGEAVKTVVGLLPFLVAIFFMLEVFYASGLAESFSNAIAPVFNLLGIPKELTLLVLLKPFSGSGSIGVLNDIYVKYGVDSYLARTASCIIAASDTLFFIIAMYFSKTNVKKLWLVIPIALASNLVGAIISSLICRIL